MKEYCIAVPTNIDKDIYQKILEQAHVGFVAVFGENKLKLLNITIYDTKHIKLISSDDELAQAYWQLLLAFFNYEYKKSDYQYYIIPQSNQTVISSNNKI